MCQNAVAAKVYPCFSPSTSTLNSPRTPPSPPPSPQPREVQIQSPTLQIPFAQPDTAPSKRTANKTTTRPPPNTVKTVGEADMPCAEASSSPLYRDHAIKTPFTASPLLNTFCRLGVLCRGDVCLGQRTGATCGYQTSITREERPGGTKAQWLAGTIEDLRTTHVFSEGFVRGPTLLS